jgi:hypothetical protein
VIYASGVLIRRKQAMSKLRGSFFSLVARGSVGKYLTVRRSKGKQIGVQFSKPGGVPSEYQLGIRSIIKDLGIFWQSLTPSQRVAWSVYSAVEGRRASGYSVYTILNFERARHGEALLAWPPGYPLTVSVWELEIAGSLELRSDLVPGVSGLFEVAGDGSVMPDVGSAVDTYFELDGSSDVEPLDV